MIRKQRKKVKTEERISQRVLYLIIGFSTLVFLLFFIFGVQAPFTESPVLSTPFFIDVLIIFMWVLLGTALFVMLFSIFRTIRKISNKARRVNGIPVYKISLIIFCATLFCLVLSFILGSSKEMVINGIPFTDKFWLKISEMFVNTSFIMLIAAVGVTIFGGTRYNRKERK